MANSKPRILNNNRDMVWSLIPLVIACLLIAGVASQCSLSPGGPKQGPIPNFDVNTALQYDASEIGFPVRNPSVPEGWTPNSGSRATISGDNGGAVSTVGYITGTGAYLQLTQSSASEEQLVPFVAGSETAYASGAQNVSGRDWVVYGEEGSRNYWVSDFGDVRILLGGTATTEDFTTLAAILEATEPLVP
ncbi:DUF4245 domain-containing protein [Rhodococcus sp. 06-412-2C]|uniref:DUF4245 domain-containing protein n=1 Tax=Nocardiaceae TaxID=85025 RepID=UPI00050BE29F|nr:MULTISPECIES: DUF4245 domain-containing protein [Rhodococcus]OZC91013.1 DUF4245 domain-containing protein [Rhodococcus sp. 06-412-2C]OZC91324.1 DUF4245 domain-containing protein [Rhodococcus sp. 06-412-2B]OZC91375.1 DUF4245 domain-containing protein [Rhodococcus sp. 06-412-2B]